MVLAAREGATGRPEEVLDALGLAEGFFRIRRKRLFVENHGGTGDAESTLKV
jgi:hypothetical protein